MVSVALVRVVVMFVVVLVVVVYSCCGIDGCCLLLLWLWLFLLLKSDTWMDSIWGCSQRHSENQGIFHLYFYWMRGPISKLTNFRVNLKSGSMISNQPLCLLQRHHPIEENILGKSLLFRRIQPDLVFGRQLGSFLSFWHHNISSMISSSFVP